jgi:hypothetical protein
LSVGTWASVEPYRAEEDDLSDTGLGERGIGEIDAWVEGEYASGLLDVGVGWIAYFFQDDPGLGGRDNQHNTSEIYGRCQLSSVPLVPKLEAWYDLDYVKGAYLEGSLDLRVPLLPLRLGPVRSVHFTALAGWSAGQEVNESDATEGAYFAEAGLTHIDLSAWSSFVVADDWSVAPVLHFQINDDVATKRINGDPLSQGSDTKWWFAIYVSWSHRFAGGDVGG